jgi:hypothetical protein
MTPVRTQIVDTILEDLRALEMVGHVSDVDTRNSIAEQRITEILSTGKAYVEIGIGSDEPEQNHSTLIRKTFPIFLLCHLPDNRPDGVSYRAYADQLYAEVVGLIEDETDPSVGTWGGLAEQTIDQGGGGIGQDPGGMGTTVTVFEMDVVYRHARGDLEALR